MTYIPTWAGFLYLAVVLDTFSRRIVGWAMETHLRTELVLQAPNLALWQRRPAAVIHHSPGQKVALLVVDELGFVPFERAGGELLFNLLAQRYERRSTIITTNLAFSEWVNVFGDEKLTTALLIASAITPTF